jgi:hypothetical protein
MPIKTEFPIVFEKLKSIIKPYASKFKVKADTPDSFYLEGKYSEKWKNELFFASTQIKKNYVSFYLMPVYMYPDLLKGISPDLKKHMQGKSCFNFKKIEPALFDELSELTKMGFDRLMKEEYS